MKELPQGWEVVPIGAISQVVGGSTPKTSRPEYWDGDIAWITPNDLSGYKGKYIARGERSLTPEGYDSCSARMVPTGTVLFTSRAPIGYVAIASGPVCTNQGFKSFVPSERVRSDYLYWYLRYATPKIGDMGSGTTFSEISGKVAKAIPVVLAPPEEQQRIVELIEEQFSRLETGVESLHRAQRNLSRLRATTVRSLFNPDWPLVPLGDVAQVVGGITKDRQRESDADAVEIPYLRVANVQRGYLDLSEIKTIRAPLVKIHSLLLESGDVLMTEGGDRDKLGRGWVWRSELTRCIHQNHIFRARLDLTRFVPEFISMYANYFGQHWFERMGKQTTNLASISLTNLRKFPVPAPTFDQQQGVIAEVDRQLSIIDSMVATIDAGLQRAKALRQSILSQAFSGRLTGAAL